MPGPGFETSVRICAQNSARAQSAQVFSSRTRIGIISRDCLFLRQRILRGTAFELRRQTVGEAALERALRNQMGPMYFPVGLERMSGLGEIAELASDHARIGNFSVNVVALNHPGGCAGFRIEANGNAIGYLPDHEPYKNGNGRTDARQSALIDFVRDLDLLILDTQFTETEYQRHIGWGHGSLPESVALAMER